MEPGLRAGPSREEPVHWLGRDCIVRGVDPMSVVERRVELEDIRTGERFRIRLDDLCDRPSRTA